ncbi:MAG: glutamate--cysteine ligase [Betaproteobacteria bacterium]|jgi:glutamate--cysteine ligase|nr:glutamate--cysteine ligase [Betaproteobacteria bacterium]
METKMRALPPEVLRGIRRGIEKESLRVRPDGMLADTPHPAGLGSALAHPHITTDFSESQLELITGVHTDVDACLTELEQIHQVVYREIGDEMLWCASMPCGLPADDAIPIGQYGRSNVGRAKTVYRLGLSYRYGRRMQTISGVHYNFSLPETAWPLLQEVARSDGAADYYQDEAYFALMRNFRRHSWLLLYLFGASPTVCSTFVAGRAHRLNEFGAGTLFLPHATSLRMGPLGYQSDAQATLGVSYNSLGSYAKSLHGALTEPYPPYEAIGIRNGDEYRQLSTSLLQIENEFYGTIRPKRRIRTGERPLHALGERGVEYVEVRLMDLDPFCPLGIAAGTMRFLDVFLLHCLLHDSPPDTPEEVTAITCDRQRVAESGRDAALQLVERGTGTTVGDRGAALLDECEPIAAALDAAHGGSSYRSALTDARAALGDPARVPSARMVREITERYANSYVQFGKAQSLRHREALLKSSLAPETQSRFVRLAEESLAAQRRIEATDKVPFETYRQQYINQSLLGGPHLR